MWERRNLSTLEIGDLRVRDLNLGEGDKVFQASLRRVARELRAKGLFFPISYRFSTDWYVTQGSRTVAVPFYLANASLRRMAHQELGNVEGLKDPERTKIWRHELGHVVANAMRVSSRADFSKVFGKGRPYPRTYLPLSHSHLYVRNLADGYAQSHPDEDFAETFAVWLDPRSAWRKRYLGTPALVKLEWVDTLLGKFQTWKAAPLDRSQERNVQVKVFFASERRRRARPLTPVLKQGLPRILGSRSNHAVRTQLARQSGCYLYQIDWLLRGVTPKPGSLSAPERKVLTLRVAREAARYFQTGRSPLVL